MTLHGFIEDHQSEILAMAKIKIAENSPNNECSDELDRGLPMFYGHLIKVLKRVDELKGIGNAAQDDETQSDAERYGAEASRLGYTASQVVHAYGALCQSITEYAYEHEQDITPKEFHGFNFAMDAAVAEAVMAFLSSEKRSQALEFQTEIGALAHELRNPLSNAIMALEAIRLGAIGVNGNTGQLLDRSLQRMLYLVQEVVEKARLNRVPNKSVINLSRLINESVTSLQAKAEARNISLNVNISGLLEVNADYEQLVSVISNLTENAIKFTKPSTAVTITAFSNLDKILIQVEDHCGGLPPGPPDALFKPYVQKDANKSGAGLGLNICQKIVESHEGTLTVLDHPGLGCVFCVSLPIGLDGTK